MIYPLFWQWRMQSEKFKYKDKVSLSIRQVGLC